MLLVRFRGLFPGLLYLFFIPFLSAQAHQESDVLMPFGKDGSMAVSTPALDSLNHQPEGIIHIQPEDCGQRNGSIRMTTPVDRRECQFSIDGLNFQSNPSFQNLVAGWYTIYILDEAGSIQIWEAEVPARNDIRIEEITIAPTDCIHPTGALTIFVSGGNEPYTYALNDKEGQSDFRFQELGEGKYPLRITDAAGCTSDTIVMIPKNPCPVYIPNVFSPNGDGVNDLFQIRIAGNEDVLITRFFIFDRWGNNVYKRYNLRLQTTEDWWDGTYKHFTSSAGTFDYYLEVEFENGKRETFKGNLTLIR